MNPAMAGDFDRRTLGRRLTQLTDATVAEVLAARRDAPVVAGGDAHRIGFTGPPGAGKSTLIGELARRRLEAGRQLGIVCVDPTSPHTGGSILGDRIRIDDAAVGDTGLYLRSIPSRASEDGLSDNLPDLLAALGDQPFDELWVETVGVGQAAYGVRRCVDTVIVLVLPGSGDTIQAMKAGILEVGHVYVVSKGDLPGADRVAAELRATLVPPAGSDWTAPVILTSASTGLGLDELGDAIDAHRRHVGRNRSSATLDRARHDVERLLHRRVHEIVAELDPASDDLATLYHQVIDRLAAETARPDQEATRR